MVLYNTRILVIAINIDKFNEKNTRFFMLFFRYSIIFLTTIFAISFFKILI